MISKKSGKNGHINIKLSVDCEDALKEFRRVSGAVDDACMAAYKHHVEYLNAKITSKDKKIDHLEISNRGLKLANDRLIRLDNLAQYDIGKANSDRLKVIIQNTLLVNKNCKLKKTIKRKDKYISSIRKENEFMSAVDDLVHTETKEIYKSKQAERARYIKSWNDIYEVLVKLNPATNTSEEGQ